MSTRLLEGPGADGASTGDTDADHAFEELHAAIPEWAEDIRSGRIRIEAVSDYFPAVREDEITGAWTFPDGSVLRLQVGMTADDPTRVWVIEPPTDECSAEAQRAKPCLLGWYPSRLPDGEWGSRHDAAAVLPDQLVGRRIVVQARKNRQWSSEILEVVERDGNSVLVRDGKPYLAITDADRKAAANPAPGQSHT